MSLVYSIFLLHQLIFSMFYFHRCTLAMKTKLDEILTDKKFYRWKFPNLRYYSVMYLHWVVSVVSPLSSWRNSQAHQGHMSALQYPVSRSCRGMLQRRANKRGFYCKEILLWMYRYSSTKQSYTHPVFSNESVVTLKWMKKEKILTIWQLKAAHTFNSLF